MEQNILNAIKLRILEPIPERVSSQYISQLRCDIKRLIKAFEDERLETNAARATLAVYQYQKAEGRLVELPCKIWDALYVVDTDPTLSHTEVKTRYVDNAVVCDGGEIVLNDDCGEVICTAENIVKGSTYLDYYRVFTNREKAEKLINELEKET